MDRPEVSLRDSLAAALKELGEGRVDNAERMSVDLLRSRPDDFASHQLAATVALRRARYSEAERWSRSCLSLRPGHAPAMLIAGRAARAHGDLERARDWFGRANEAAPDRSEPAFLLCVTQLECGDPAAKESLARVLRKFPHDSEGWSQIGAALRKANQLEAAALAFARAFAASEEAAHAIDQASALMALGRIKEAVAALRGALVIASDSVEVILALVRGLRRLAEHRDALALLDRIAILHPDDSRIDFALGLVYDDLHDSSGAIAAYRRCIALRPDLPEAQVNLGVALQQTGELQAAKDCYCAAISARPDTFGRIAQALPSTRRGELWLNLGKLRRSLGG
jgi:tetratricopeptide (TPR) repeat protein